MMKFGFPKLDSGDRLVVLGALGIFAISLYCFLFDTSFFGIWKSDLQKKSNQPVIGQINFFENDTRHQQEGSFAWRPAEEKQEIRIGDGVFTGAHSRTQVSLKEGAHINMGENTLMVFRKVQGLEIPNLATGNFRIKVSGEMKLAVAGKVTEIKGENSEIQVFLSKKNPKPQIKLLQGTAKVKQEEMEKPVELKTNEVVLLKEPTDEEAIKELAAENTLTQPFTEQPPPLEPKVVQKADAASETISYTDQLYDFYEKKESSLTKRSLRPNYITFKKTVSWESQGEVTKVYGQHSKTGDFSQSVFPFEASGSEFTLNYVFLGENFVRISTDQNKWDAPRKFMVEVKPLGVQAPKISFVESEVKLLDGPSKIQGNLNSTLSKFVVEASRDPSFSIEKTKVLWLSKNEFHISVSEEGAVYFKARGLNEKLELTAESEVFQVRVLKPMLPIAPRLAKEEIQVFTNETARLEWTPSQSVKDHDVVIKDKNNTIVLSKNFKKNGFNWKPSKVGEYKVEISAKDQYGRKSKDSTFAKIQVQPKLVPEPIKQAAKEVEKENPRKPASVEPISRYEMKTEDKNKTNESLSASRFQIEGGYFSMHAQDKDTSPKMIALTGRVLNWWDTNGLEGSIKSKVASASSETSQVPTPLQLEARYHRRWNLPFNLLSASGGTQISFIAGYEYYRNSTPGYSPGYDLLKTGFSVDFPVLRKWDTGGEILYGYGLDQSTKYEIAGHIDYYPQINWSIGLGYKVHLFQAGSDKSAPAMGVPYREGYGEAYSALRWHY